MLQQLDFGDEGGIEIFLLILYVYFKLRIANRGLELFGADELLLDSFALMLLFLKGGLEAVMAEVLVVLDMDDDDEEAVPDIAVEGGTFVALVGVGVRGHGGVGR